MAKFNNSKNFSIKKLLERRNEGVNSRNFAISNLIPTTSAAATTSAERLVKIQQTGQGNIKERRKFNSFEEQPTYEQEILPALLSSEGFSCLSAGQSKTGRYQTRGFRVKGVFEAEPTKTYPEELLKQLFEKFLNFVNKKAAENGVNAAHFICIISSKSLGYDIVEHLHTLDLAAEKIFNRFLYMEEYNKARGNQSIILGPFGIDVTAVQLTNKRGHPGASRRKLPSVKNFADHFINQNALDRIENEDSYCLFRSLELLRNKKEMTKQRFCEYRRNEQAIMADIQRLLETTGINPDEEFYDIEICGEQIQNYYDQLAPNTYKIMAFDGSSYKPFWRSQADNYTQVLCIFHSQNEEEFHYDPIKSIYTLFHKRASYCFTCETPYHTPRTHAATCKSRCWGCLQMGPDFPCGGDGSNARFCDKCAKTFKNIECYKAHLVGKGKNKKSTCDVHKKCLNCGVIYDVRVNSKNGGHKCLQKFCKRCFTFHENRPCFIQKYEAKNQKERRLIFTDFECKTHHRPIADELKFQHQVNFIWAYLTCTKCIAKKCWEEPSECEICGPKRSFAWAPFDFTNTEVDCFTEAANPLEAFTHWVLNFEQIELPANKQPKVENIVYTHCGSRYDNIFIYGQVLRTEKVLPTLIRNGNRLYEMIVKGRGLTTTKFRDSFHLIPLKLANFVKTFGLKIPGIEGKKFFPHAYNKEENYEKILNGLPNIEDYCPQSMMPADAAELKEWHEANKNSGEFLLKEILADYCRADVMILVHGLIYMRNDYLEYTGVDLFESITIPSASMKCFRKDLPTDQLALVPHMGYEKHWKQSTLGRIFVKWFAEENGVRVQSADSPEGEYKLGPYRLDGFVRRPGQEKDLGIEVMGCYWHACGVCHPNDQQILACGTPAWKLRENNAKRLDFLREHIDVQVFYEHEIHEMIEQDSAMKAYFDNAALVDSGPMKLADAFFGGRTEVHKMYSSRVQKPHRRTKYYDVRSMYPFINYSAHYPVSHPNLVVYDKDVDWTEEADMVDDDGRPILGDNDRGFSASLTHPELAMALNSGYRVTRLHRALQWSEEQFSADLFKPYIRKWMKLKYEASGWPSECLDETVSEEERERRKQWYIDEASRYGIILDREKIEFNPGRRYIAKLALNSLWGRFALKCRLSQSILVHSAAQMAKYLENKQIDVNMLEHMHGDTYLICYKTKDEYVVEHQSANIILALWTTSNARVHLLEKVNEAFEGRDDVELLYMDTDSILVEFDAARGEPIKTGDQLGSMGDEYPDHEIIEFICMAPKSYVIWLRSNADGNDKYVWRCKGLPLNTEVMGRLSFERFKEMAHGIGDPDQFEMMPIANNFRIQRKGEIMTIPMEKKLRPTTNKGNVDNQYKIRHFGYSDPDWCRAHNPFDCTCKH